MTVLGAHLRAAVNNAFRSTGYRRFGLAFARDYLRFGFGTARRWGDTGPGVLRWLGHDVRYADRMATLFLVHEIMVRGTYDFEPRRPDPVIVDCGANVGLASLFFLLRFPRARIVAVEPHPGAFRLLETNTRTFGAAVERVAAAVTEDGGPTVLHTADETGASLISSIAAADAGLREIPVAGVTLTELIARAAGDGEVDFLKLDVEGAEYGAFREARRTGALRRVREAAIEFHRLAAPHEDPASLVAALRESGFTAITLRDEKAGVDGIIRAARDGAPRG